MSPCKMTRPRPPLEGWVATPKKTDAFGAPTPAIHLAAADILAAPRAGDVCMPQADAAELHAGMAVPQVLASPDQAHNYIANSFRPQILTDDDIVTPKVIVDLCQGKSAEVGDVGRETK